MPIYLQWLDENTFAIDGVRFLMTYDSRELQEWQSTKNAFVLEKASSMISNLISMTSKMEVNHIFDLRIFKGGSIALYAKLFNPNKIIAVDYVAEPVHALDEFVTESGLADHVRLYYGVDQSDQVAMADILSKEFPNRDIDLVVDDASHFYHETKTSFNLIFPYLRPGGLYIIEDWAWAHWSGDFWQEHGGVWPDKPALTNLVVEILMLSASRPDLIDDVLINHNTVFVRRGYAELTEKDVDVLSYCLTRGKGFVPIL